MTQPDADATPNTAPAPVTEWAQRADEAARSVTHLFGQRLFFLPGTHIAATARPSGRIENLRRPWHYWWQAHYLDCLVDTGLRELGKRAALRQSSTAIPAPAPASSPHGWSPASGCGIS